MLIATPMLNRSLSFLGVDVRTSDATYNVMRRALFNRVLASLDVAIDYISVSLQSGFSDIDN